MILSDISHKTNTRILKKKNLTMKELNFFSNFWIKEEIKVEIILCLEMKNTTTFSNLRDLASHIQTFLYT